jgi:F0F1-type ATP synthase, beta subunit
MHMEDIVLLYKVIMLLYKVIMPERGNTMDELHLNAALLRSRVPNLTSAAKAVGLRPATVSNLCTGKIPVGRAEVRTLAALAELAGCTIDELLIKGARMELLETGIKVLDLLAPIVRGGIAGVVARPMTGQMVMLAELMIRLRRQGARTIFWKPLTDVPGTTDVEQAVENVCVSGDEVIRSILSLPAQQDVVLGTDRETSISGELFELQERIKAAGARSVTILLVDTRGDASDEDIPYGPLDTYLKFDTELSARGMYPAVDPVSSTSVLLEGAQIQPMHIQLQQAAKRLMRRYRELRPIVIAQGVERLPAPELLQYQRGERLEAYLTQPFFVAEPYSGRPGLNVSLDSLLMDVRSILAGDLDEKELDRLLYIGSISGIVSDNGQGGEA